MAAASSSQMAPPAKTTGAEPRLGTEILNTRVCCFILAVFVSAVTTSSCSSSSSDE